MPKSSPKYSIDIVQVRNIYTLREPEHEHPLPFIFEAAKFIRDHSSNEYAVVKLKNGETMPFGACGLELGHALHNLYGYFIVHKRDQFLSIIVSSKLDKDMNLEIAINPAQFDRGKNTKLLSDANVVASYMSEISMYFDVFLGRHMLPEYLAMINANIKDIRRATPVNKQLEIGRMPIRFVGPNGRRIFIVNRQHPMLGPVVDLDFN